MYNIQLSASPSFNSNPASKPPQTGWVFAPPTPIEVISFIGQSNPSDIDIETTIKNYILALGNGTYSDFYVKFIKVDPVINGIHVPLMEVTGEIPDATGDGYHLSQVNLDVNTILDFDLTNIPAGYFRTDLLIQVMGNIEEFFFQQVELVRFIVNVRRLNYNDISITPLGPVEIDYLLGGAIPPGVERNVYVNGAFTVEVGDHIALSGGNLVLDSDVDGIT